MLSKKFGSTLCFSNTIFTSMFFFILFLLPGMSFSVGFLIFLFLGFMLNSSVSHFLLISLSKVSLPLHIESALCFVCFLIFKFYSCLHLHLSQCLVMCLAPSTYFLNVYWFEKSHNKINDPMIPLPQWFYPKTYNYSLGIA